MLWKAYVLPHFAYSAIAAKSAKAATPMKNLEKNVRMNFKKFMGLKKSTSNTLLTQLTGFSFEDFSDKMQKLADFRWNRRCGRRAPPPIFKETAQLKKLSKCATKHINWDIIQCWNMLYGKCKASKELKSWRHLKECHGISNRLIKSLSPMTVMNRDFRRKVKNLNLTELACKLRGLMEDQSNCTNNISIILIERNIHTNDEQS